LHIDFCYKESEGTVLKMSKSSDPHLASTATKLLGSMQVPAAPDVIISAVGNTKDPHVVEPLLKIATDPEQPKGKQADMEETHANLGDQRAAEPVADMMRYADNRASSERICRAYNIRS
jgi:hypothetical protein